VWPIFLAYTVYIMVVIRKYILNLHGYKLSNVQAKYAILAIMETLTPYFLW